MDYGLRPVDYGLRPVDYARCGFPSTSCSGAYIRTLAHAVDYARGSRCGLRSRVSLWITAYRPVDYDATHLWITHADACCGLRMLTHAVDYARWRMLWITHAGACCGLGEGWGLASPPHPSGRTESCTLRILRMLFWAHGGCGWDNKRGAEGRICGVRGVPVVCRPCFCEGRMMQGDTAPCGTTDRNSVAPPLHFSSAPPSPTPSTCSAFRSAFSSISSILWFLPPHAVLFLCVLCILWFPSTLAVLRVALF